MMQRKMTACILILSVILALLPQTAQAKTTTKTFQYIAGDELPDVPDHYVEDGIVYRLKTPMPKPKVKSRFTTSRNFSVSERKDEISVASVTNEKYQESFEALIKVDQEGYTGVASRQSFEFVPYYVSRQRVVEKTVTHNALPTNDISQIPTSATFTVTSDVGDNTTTEATLELAALKWEVQRVDAYGTAQSYRATATYRGLESYRTKEDYTVVTYYQGVATRPGQNMELEVEYASAESTSAPNTIEFDLESIYDEDLSQERGNFLLRLLAAIAGSLVIVVAFLRAPNARIADQDDNTTKRLRLKKSGKDTYSYRMPTSLLARLYPSNEYYLIPSERLITDGATLTVNATTTTDTICLYAGQMSKQNRLEVDIAGREEEMR